MFDMLFKKELSTIEKGRLGENAACRYLKKQGYRILCRNFDTGFAEIDIIAQKDGTVVFIEVKTRKETVSMPAYMSVGYKKKIKIMKAAGCYIAKLEIKPKCRFDIIEVYCDEKYKKFKFKHIENAFGSDLNYAVF